ncbi:MAG: NGG1p interacting factor [Candidatus Doudnabacteria bacterium]|nr:NGG1p interacting factor [Candidatus Doudnabacteria bacterium]
MKLEQIYELNIECGIRSDLRGVPAVKKQLERVRMQYQTLSKEAQANFDTELLINPYTDSRLLYGDLDTNVKKVLAGIDMQSGEVAIADRIGNIDLIIAHHPEGKSLAKLDEQMHIQAEILAAYGVPINIAQGAVKERIAQVSRKLHGENTERAVDAARLLDIPYLNAHTTCDNLSASFIKDALDKAKPQYVSEIMSVLKSIPEYQIAEKQGTGPMIFAGAPGNYCGKVVVTEFTGGTNGAKQMYERMAHAGIGTIISMHISEEHRKEAESNHLNVVVAGHMSSDSLGMNLFLDELEKRGVEIIPTSGLIRVSRNNSKNKKTKKLLK